MGVVDGRAEDETVGILRERAEFVHAIVKDARAGLAAAAARHAACGGFGADPEDLAVDPLIFERRGDLGERPVGASLFMRASVDEQDLHEGSFPMAARQCGLSVAFSSV